MTEKKKENFTDGHEGHENHLCSLVNRRQMAQAAKAVKDAKYMCQICGRGANDKSSLCEPFEI